MNKILAILKSQKFWALLGGLLTALGGTAYGINANAGAEALASNATAIGGMLGSGALLSAVGAFLSGSPTKTPSPAVLEAKDMGAICHIRSRAHVVPDPTVRAQMLAACDGLTAALFRLSEQEASNAATK